VSSRPGRQNGKYTYAVVADRYKHPPIPGQHLPNLAVRYISARSYVTGYSLEMLCHLHVVYLAMVSDYDRRKIELESTLLCTEAFVA